MDRGLRLDALAWPAVPDPAPAVVVPLGSTEQHGPHLTFDTDTAIAAELARRLCAARPGFVLAPALAYGASGEHEGFPGTLSLGREVLELAVLELGRSAGRWADRLLVVNGHGGNLAPLTAAVERLRAEGREVAHWSPRIVGGDAHAGVSETAMMLALRPAAVGPERTPGPTGTLAELLPRLVSDGVRVVSPNGVLGNPAGADAADGHRLLATLAADLDAFVDGWLTTSPRR